MTPEEINNELKEIAKIDKNQTLLLHTREMFAKFISEIDTEDHSISLLEDFQNYQSKNNIDTSHVITITKCFEAIDMLNPKYMVPTQANKRIIFGYSILAVLQDKALVDFANQYDRLLEVSQKSVDYYDNRVKKLQFTVHFLKRQINGK